MGQRVLACPDKFRGSATAAEVCGGIAAAATTAGFECARLPLADGGEGTLEALGGPNRHTTVSGPLGEQVSAAWRLDGEIAVVEAARACGLALTGGSAGNDPMSSTTTGVGELLVAAVVAGARQVLLGVGGSATTDGGAGALAALSAAGIDPRRDVRVSVCCDVATPFTRAAEVFGPQKGASTADIARLTERLQAQRADYLSRFDIDVDLLPGGGAAGGLAGGLAAAGAELVAGFDAIAGHVGLDTALAGADLVVTGEGCLDATSVQGKVVGGVLSRASAAGLPCVVVCGTARIALDLPVLDLSARFGSQRSWDDTIGCVQAGLTELWRS